MMSACGVICSECPAYHAQEKGIVHQKRVAEAWHRIYQLDEPAEHISCGGCMGSDEKIFHTCRSCKARLCCRSKGFGSCAECSLESCTDLRKAQSNWDEVPNLSGKLSASDFAEYAQPYFGYRKRLADARTAFRNRR